MLFVCLFSIIEKRDNNNLLFVQYKKEARGLLTASSDYTLPNEMAEGRHKIENEVVLKDRMLDTVAIGRLLWSVEIKEA